MKLHLETRINRSYSLTYPHVVKLTYKDGHLIPDILPINDLRPIPPTGLDTPYTADQPYDILINEVFSLNEGDIIEVVGQWMKPPWHAETELTGRKQPKGKKPKKGEQYIIEGYYNVLSNELLEIDKHQALNMCVDNYYQAKNNHRAFIENTEKINDFLATENEDTVTMQVSIPAPSIRSDEFAKQEAERPF